MKVPANTVKAGQTGHARAAKSSEVEKVSDPVLYVMDGCPSGPKPITVNNCLAAANRTVSGSVEEIFCPLASGAAVVVRTEVDDPVRFLARCREQRLTHLSLPTAYWHELCAQLDTEYVAVPVTLRLAIIGGERALPARLAQWQQWAGTGVRLVNTYGPTEATIVATRCELSDAAESSAWREVPIGRPIPNARAYLLDRNLELMRDPGVCASLANPRANLVQLGPQ